MYENISNLSGADLNLYWGNTFIPIRKKNGSGFNIFHAREFNSGYSKSERRWIGTRYWKKRDGSGFARKADDINVYDESLLYYYPDIKMINTKNATVLLRRRPSRQYKRGLTQRNTSFISMTQGDNVPFEEIIYTVFNIKPYRLVSSVINDLRSGKKVSEAISNRYFLLNHGNSLYLCTYMKVIGSFDDRNILHLHENLILFKEEIQELGINIHENI